MSKIAFLKPKAASSPQVIEYVWASDSKAIIVDLSGSTTVRLNANDPKNGLTRLLNDDGTEKDIWQDATGKLYNLDASGNDISGSLFPLSFFVTNENGPRNLTRVVGSTTRFSLPTFSVVDKLFTDQNGTAYYTSYRTNVPLTLQNPIVDISLTKLAGSSGPNNNAGNDFVFTPFDNSNNKITIDLSGFRSSTAYNPVQYDICLNLNTGFQLSTYAAARADVSNQLIVRMYQFGMGSTDRTITKYSSVTNQTTTIDLSVNVLNASGILHFDTSGAGIINAQNALLQPNVDLMSIVPSTVTFTKSGRQNVSVPITIPAGTSGCWIWNAYITDGNLVSTPVAITLNVQPSFSAPIITLDSTTSSTLIPGLGEPAKYNIKLADSSFVPDICNNLTRGMLVYPRINAVGANVTGDVTLTNLNNGLIVTGFNTTSAFIANDLSLNTLTFADVSNNNIGLILSAADISLNPNTGLYFKVQGRDVSRNITIDASSNDFHLPSRQFNLLLDWLPNAQPGADTNGVTVQTATVGTVNINTTYTSTVNLVDNKDGTYSLSLSDLNGPLDNASYEVRVFKDDKCTQQATFASDISMTSQTNIFGASGNSFNVQMDSNFNATFTGPSLYSKSGRVYMVAYIKRTNVFLYTASTPVSVIYAKYPILNVTFDTVNAFTAADLNKIVNIDELLEVNTTISDLSGYIVNSINAGIDLSCNLSLPTWDLNGPTLTFTLNDSNGVVKSMDISGNATKRTRLLPNIPITFNNISDVSNNLGFFVDLSFNSVKTPSIFTLNIALGDAAGNYYPSADRTIAFYYKGFGPSLTNQGGIKNTIIVFNDAKYTLDPVSSLTQMVLGPMDSFNTYTWLSGSALNTYSLNLARTEFVGPDHTLDASGFKIADVNTTNTTNGETPNLYIQFNGDWASRSTATGGSGMGRAGITTTFARNTYSWIDMKKFVGFIDINYCTKNANGISVTPNTLRMIVVPRPNIQATIAVTPNVLINTPATLQLTIKNVQKNKAGNEISIANWGPQDVSSNKPLSGKFRTLLAVGSGSLSLVTAAGVPDIANAGFFTLPSVGDMLYGNAVIVPITFRGRSTAGQVASNIKANYSMIGSKIISGTSELTVNVYSTGSTFNDSIFTNNLSANTSINFAGMPFVQYVALDNSNNTINLDTNARTKNAAFVVVENKGSATSASLTATNSIVGTATIAAGGVAVYQHRDSSTPGTNIWVFCYAKN